MGIAPAEATALASHYQLVMMLSSFADVKTNWTKPFQFFAGIFMALATVFLTELQQVIHLLLLSESDNGAKDIHQFYIATVYSFQLHYLALL